MKLSPLQIAQLAAAAGFSGDALPTAVAICLAESAGDPNAYNPERAAGTPVGMGSYGLWQIYLKAHAEFSGWNLYDPQLNARAAYSIYAAGGSFRPWTSYTRGKYLQFMNVAIAAINALGPAPNVEQPAAAIDPGPGQIIFPGDTSVSSAQGGPPAGAADLPTADFPVPLLLLALGLGFLLLFED